MPVLVMRAVGRMAETRRNRASPIKDAKVSITAPATAIKPGDAFFG